MELGPRPRDGRPRPPRAAEWSTPRAQSCALARSIELAWTPEQLQDPGLAAELIEQAIALQITSRALAAPYLEVGGDEDSAIEANCALLSLTAERATDQRVVAYLQTLGGRLLDGSAETVAERYVAAGAETIFIRVRRFDPRNLEHVLAYIKLVEHIEVLGARAVADSVGHFGAVAIAAGAFAFSAGARFFRKVPDALLARSSESSEAEDEEKDGGGGPRSSTSIPASWSGSTRTRQVPIWAPVRTRLPGRGRQRQGPSSASTQLP